MNPVLGWGLATLAVAAGYWVYGWPGVVLAVTMIVFWLLLQFGRALRAMRDAGGRPVGAIDSAAALDASLRPGMSLVQVIQITRSLGVRTAEHPETWAWTDPHGASVSLELARGRLVRWTLAGPKDRAE